jgi:predicted adenylyl cyclase CyaB
MARNVELKARVADLPALRGRLALLDAIGPEELVQTDTYFVVSSGRLKLREFGDGMAELIVYQRPDTSTAKLSNYMRVPASSQLRDVLALSLGVRATVRKRRSVFLLGQTRIHLDEVESLGAFIELEVVLHDDQTVVEGERTAMSVLEALAVPAASLISHGYVDLLLNSRTPGRPDAIQEPSAAS